MKTLTALLLAVLAAGACSPPEVEEGAIPMDWKVILDEEESCAELDRHYWTLNAIREDSSGPKREAFDAATRYADLRLTEGGCP